VALPLVVPGPSVFKPAAAEISLTFFGAKKSVHGHMVDVNCPAVTAKSRPHLTKPDSAETKLAIAIFTEN
jgi:hypothetical protein